MDKQSLRILKLTYDGYSAEFNKDAQIRLVNHLMDKIDNLWKDKRVTYSLLFDKKGVNDE